MRIFNTGLDLVWRVRDGFLEEVMFEVRPKLCEGVTRKRSRLGVVGRSR